MRNTVSFYQSRVLNVLLPIAVMVVLVYYVALDYDYRPRDELPVALDGCKHVYLDVGSNVGIQVRKLFEPSLYPNAPALEVFDAHFGSDAEVRRRTVCVVGFEPNKKHAKRLKRLEEAYNRCGWRTFFFTQTAVSDHQGRATFYTDQNKAKLEWGASLVAESEANVAVAGKVDLLRLNDFILQNVRGRRLEGQQRGRVLMKMDIEGSEIEVLKDMLVHGGLFGVDAMMVEWHDRLANGNKRRKQSRSLQRKLQNIQRTKPFELLNVDDEEYMLSNFPLPKC